MLSYVTLWSQETYSSEWIVVIFPKEIFKFSMNPIQNKGDWTIDNAED